MPLLHCEFVPQAWINDNAVRVDHMPGRRYTWAVPWPEDKELPDPYSDETDMLRNHDSAPDWTRDWDGPFEVSYKTEKVS